MINFYRTVVTWIIDSAGNSSNKLTGTFTVTASAFSLSSNDDLTSNGKPSAVLRIEDVKVIATQVQ